MLRKLAFIIFLCHNADMTKTRVPITRVDQDTPPLPFITMLGGTFILGILIGVMGAFSAHTSPNIDPSTLVGAVINSTVNEETESGQVGTNDGSTKGNIDPSLSAVTPADGTRDLEGQDEAVLPTESPVATEQGSTRDELQLAIDRTNKELERVKNESIELITSFNQSCGSWNDVCALPYVEALEKNNANYQRLTDSLNILQRRIGSAQ